MKTKLNKSNLTVKIYTDGACSGNPGPGGWGAYLQYGDKEKKIWGSAPNTTNNQMEIRAAIEALKILKKNCIIDLYTDSKYVQLGITKWMVNWIANNWRTSNNKPVKNIELWQELKNEIIKHKINWHWVKGHANNLGNIIADDLAVRGRDEAINEVK